MNGSSAVGMKSVKVRELAPDRVPRGLRHVGPGCFDDDDCLMQCSHVWVVPSPDGMRYFEEKNPTSGSLHNGREGDLEGVVLVDESTNKQLYPVV